MRSPNVKLPDESTLIEAARRIVFTARRENQLSSLTVRTVRKQLQRDFALDNGALDNEGIKSSIRDAVNAAVSEEIPPDAPTTKRKRPSEDVDALVEAKRNKTGKKIVAKKGKGKSQEGEEESDTKQKRTKKSRATKSKETIESDEDDIDDAPAPDKIASTSSSKQDAGNAPKQETKPSRASLSTDKSQDVQSMGTEKSDSELSVLIDGPLKKKRAKTKVKDGAKKVKRGKDEKEPATGLSKDEETVKRLKSFVAACGARKTWSKEFANLPHANQQIKRLKEILADLGMTGRYSLEQAKKIKEQRALARELNDVLEFERKAGASRAARSRPETKSKRPIGELDTESEVSESSGFEEDVEDPESPMVKKKNTASRSIMAYLANQSSDEE